eukprot:gene12695-13997_t
MEQQGGNKRKLESDEWGETCSSLMSEKKKGPRAPWTSQDMVSAMLLVKQGMSITKAAQSLNIPRTTLRDRVTGKVKNVIKIGPQGTPGHNEKSLASYYKMMSKQGYGKTKEMILDMASKLLLISGMDQLSIEAWWLSFCSRHNQPLFDTDDVFGSTSKQQVNNVTLNDCYQQLLDTFTSNKYDLNFLERPEMIYSCNENNFHFDRINDLINGGVKIGRSSQGSENLSCSEKSPARLQTQPSFEMNQIGSQAFQDDSCSVITCVNAMGNSIPPMFIHKMDNHAVQLNSQFEKQASTRFDQDFFLTWFNDIFLKNLPRSSGPCVLIFDGDNCYVTKDLLVSAAMKDVIMFCIPASLSHALQPLDLSIDGVFHELWRSFLVQNASEKGNVSHANFSQLFLSAWKKIVTKSVVAERFRVLGIYPFFRQNAALLGMSDSANNSENSARNGKDVTIVEGSVQSLHKDILTRAVDSIGQLDKLTDANFDSNHNHLRYTGIITRPTMSNLNQPLNDSPALVQFIGNEDDYHDVNSTEDVFSSSEDCHGNPSITSVNSMASAANSKLALNKSTSSSFSVISTNQKRLNTSLASHSVQLGNSFHNGAKSQVTSPTYMKHSSVLNTANDSMHTQSPISQIQITNIKGDSLLNRAMPLNTKFTQSTSNTSAKNTSPQKRSSSAMSASTSASLNALEELLSRRRLGKFQNAFEHSQENCNDFDPLYAVWRALKLGIFHPPNSNTNQDIRTPENKNNRCIDGLDPGPQSCPCSKDEYRTIVTPSGNVSVNRNATVVVIMPEKPEDGTGPLELNQNCTQSSKESIDRL